MCLVRQLLICLVFFALANAAGASDTVSENSTEGDVLATQADEEHYDWAVYVSETMRSLMFGGDPVHAPKSLSKEEKTLLDNALKARIKNGMDKFADALVALKAYYQQTGRMNRFWAFMNGTLFNWADVIPTHSGTFQIITWESYFELSNQLRKRNADDLADFAFMRGTPVLASSYPGAPEFFGLVDWRKEKLILEHCYDEDDLKKIGGFTRYMVTAAGPYLNEILTSLGKKQNVVAIRVDINKPNDCDMSLLRFVPNLRELDISHTLTDELATKLNGLSQVRRMEIDSGQLTSAGLKPIASMTGLESLTIKSTMVDDSAIAELSSLPNLKELDISDGQLSGKCFANGFKSLVRLKLQSCPVDDQGVKAFGNLTNLRDLVILGARKIESKDVPELLVLKNLRCLSLAGSRVADDCIPELVKCKNLSTLDLRGSKVSCAGLRQLESELPNCSVCPSPKSILGKY